MFPNTPAQLLTKHGHMLARLNAASVGDLIYYTGGAWDKAGQITSAEAWFTYLRQFGLKRKQLPIIRVIN